MWSQLDRMVNYFDAEKNYKANYRLPGGGGPDWAALRSWAATRPAAAAELGLGEGQRNSGRSSRPSSRPSSRQGSSHPSSHPSSHQGPVQQPGEDAAWRCGQKVTITGLQSKPELNGKAATILGVAMKVTERLPVGSAVIPAPVVTAGADHCWRQPVAADEKVAVSLSGHVDAYGQLKPLAISRTKLHPVAIAPFVPESADGMPPKGGRASPIDCDPLGDNEPALPQTAKSVGAAGVDVHRRQKTKLTPLADIDAAPPAANDALTKVITRLGPAGTAKALAYGLKHDPKPLRLERLNGWSRKQLVNELETLIHGDDDNDIEDVSSMTPKELRALLLDLWAKAARRAEMESDGDDEEDEDWLKDFQTVGPKQRSETVSAGPKSKRQRQQSRRVIEESDDDGDSKTATAAAVGGLPAQGSPSSSGETAGLTKSLILTALEATFHSATHTELAAIDRRVLMSQLGTQTQLSAAELSRYGTEIDTWLRERYKESLRVRAQALASASQTPLPPPLHPPPPPAPANEAALASARPATNEAALASAPPTTAGTDGTGGDGDGTGGDGDGAASDGTEDGTLGFQPRCPMLRTLGGCMFAVGHKGECAAQAPDGKRQRAPPPKRKSEQYVFPRLSGADPE